MADYNSLIIKACTILSALAIGTFANAQQVLHFQRIDSYIFVDGQVNGKEGKFMLDTGTDLPFFINRDYVPVEHNDTLGTGFAGSGQKFTVCKSDDYSLSFSGFKFDNLKNTFNANLGFIQAEIYPQFLGFIGYGFIRRFKFAIDYDKSEITLFPLGTGKTVGSRKHRLLQTIHFTADSRKPNLALCDGTIDGENFNMFFDTGGSTGSLSITPEMKARLIGSGTLEIKNDDKATLRRVKVDGRKCHKLEKLELQGDSENKIGLAFEFLKHYISVWDYSTQTIELYRK